jgi:hypothetical protein
MLASQRFFTRKVQDGRREKSRIRNFGQLWDKLVGILTDHQNLILK